MTAGDAGVLELTQGFSAANFCAHSADRFGMAELPYHLAQARCGWLNPDLGLDGGRFVGQESEAEEVGG